MMNISYPNISHNKYLIWEGHVIGPVTENGIPEPESMSYRHQLDYIQNLPGAIYHEKDVMHSEHHAQIDYHPVLGGLRSEPTGEFPDQVRIVNLNLINWYGFGYHDHVAMRLGSTITLHELMLGPSHGSWIKYELNLNAGGNRLGSVTTKEIWPLAKVNATTFSCRVTTVSYLSTIGGMTVSGWRNRHTAQEIFQLYHDFSSSGKTIRSESTSVQNIAWREIVYDSLMPSELKTRVELLFIDHEMVHSNLIGKEFGELAMDASEKVNATHINMIAFLRDLRHPQELIPKLRNLRNIKGIASTYLGFKYGILPTISDLQEIAKAFERIKPHIERNGFSTFASSYTETGVVEGIQSTIEQHLKLAVDNEDNGFELLLERFESVGLLPTLENLWDLVPYSFVIDWFCDVGEFLARVDTNLRLMRMNIRYTTMSIKRKTEQSNVFTPEFPVAGSISLVRYHRWTSGLCPVPSLTSLNSRISDFNHWLESAALIIQRRK